MQPNEYTVYLDGNELATLPYGTSVTVDSAGNIYPNTSGGTYDTEKVAWSFSYAAPSNDNEATTAKFITTASAYSFIVKGSTYLTTSPAQGDETNYVVTVYSTVNNRVIDVINTTGTFTMPSPYKYPFYTFTGYSNGAAAGDEVTVSENTAIYASYAPVTENTFAVGVFNTYLDWLNWEYPEANYYNYNEKVELKGADDTYC